MNKQKSLFQERLVGLFLRLNGYFQTGLISHSDTWGDAGTDVDRIGIRFPSHSQTERGVNCSKKLMIPDKSIDIIIAEVKNKELSFNDTLKKKENRAEVNWKQILTWIGLFKSYEIENLIPKLIDLANKDGLSNNNKFGIIKHKNKFGKITIRPILFAIEKEEEANKKLWVNGGEIVEFIWECFCPAKKRCDCSTRYDFNLWGSEYVDIVKYFKDRDNNGLTKPKLKELYDELVSEKAHNKTNSADAKSRAAD